MLVMWPVMHAEKSIPPPHVDRMTNASKTLPCPKLRLQAVINYRRHKLSTLCLKTSCEKPVHGWRALMSHWFEHGFYHLLPLLTEKHLQIRSSKVKSGEHAERKIQYIPIVHNILPGVNVINKKQVCSRRFSHGVHVLGHKANWTHYLSLKPNLTLSTL